MLTNPPALGPAPETGGVAAAAPVEYTAAVDRYLGQAALNVASRRVYRISLAGWASGELPGQSSEQLANWVAGAPTPMPAYNAVAGFGFNPYDPRTDPRGHAACGRAPCRRSCSERCNRTATSRTSATRLA